MIESKTAFEKFDNS